MSHIDAGVAPELRHSPTSSEFADEKAPGKRDEEELAHHEEELLDVYVSLLSLTLHLLTIPPSTQPFPVDPDEPEETHQLTIRYAPRPSCWISIDR